MSPVTVKDLRDHILDKSAAGEFLYCHYCGGRYSANAGDYFMHKNDHVFKCCEEPMSLMTSKEVLTPIKR